MASGTVVLVTVLDNEFFCYVYRLKVGLLTLRRIDLKNTCVCLVHPRR